jgi:hypothetical protein
MRVLGIAALSFACVLVAAAAARAQEPPQIHVVNLMPAFFRAWDDGAGKPIDERVRLLKADLLYPNRKAFDTGQFRLDDPRLAWYLDEVAGRVPAMRLVTEKIATELPSSERAFVAAFPDMKPTTVYFMPSFFHFDGQSSAGILRFGVDGIVEFEGPDANLGVLAAHELFHIYHYQVNPQTFGESGSTQAPIDAQAWSEGLATYVAQRLNPSATRAQVLLSKDLAELSPANTRRLACLMEPKLASTRESDAAPFFDADVKPPGLPARGGYLIGLLVAEQLGKAHTLRELALMNGAALRAPIAAAVHALCVAP